MIVVDKLHLRAGSFELNDISFSIPTGAYGVLMGRTGSGKTRLLEAIAGLQPVAAGRISLQGRDVTRLRPAARNIGYVPQDAALFTTMTVRQQLGFALQIRKVAASVIAERVDDLSKRLEIHHLLDRTAHGLSGGEKQRIALGRALSFQPDTLLLDEPLSAVDEDTRDQMTALLKRIQRESAVTCLHVTHNQREAEALADVWLRLVDGQIAHDLSADQKPPGPTSAAG